MNKDNTNIAAYIPPSAPRPIHHERHCDAFCDPHIQALRLYYQRGPETPLHCSVACCRLLPTSEFSTVNETGRLTVALPRLLVQRLSYANNATSLSG